MPVAPGSSEPSDRELLQRAAAGDRHAFGAIYTRYKDVVYRFARAMTGSPEEAADVTQEVFVALIRDVPRYDPNRAALSTYLYGVARNLSREHLRRTRRLLSLDALGLAAARGGRDGPEEGLAGVEDASRLRLALRSLPSRYREAIILCDLHDLSYEQAADIVRTSVAAVRSRLHRGRRMLRDQLARLERKGARHQVNPVRCSV